MAPSDLPIQPSSAAPTARRVRATVMFASLSGFTALSEKLGAERAYLIVTGCLRLLDGIARKHGGSVDKYLGDALLAVFGHPAPVARPPRAAVLAALEMRRQVYAYDRELELAIPLDLQVGIATGFLVAGDIGSRVVREFHVLGDTVNVAARLKAKAPPGAIYVSRASFEEAGDGLQFRELAPLRLKGKSLPVPAWEALGVRAGTRIHGLAVELAVQTELMGRGPELARLREGLRRLETGRGGVIALLGAEGIGKSRLLAELSRVREIGALSALAVQLAAASDSTPLGAALLMLEALGGALAPSDAAPAREALETALCRSLGERCAERPLLVALEDFHLADPASLELLAALIDLTAGQPLLWLLIGREEAEGVSKLLARARSQRPEQFEAIVLAPLAETEARRLLDSASRETPLSDGVRTLLLERAGGNPARLLLGVHLAPSLVVESDQTGRAQRSSESERRRATILFADIVGFTAMTEKLGAETAYPIVTGCLQVLDAVARKHGGTVDKYMGDCVMATFGVPEAMEDAPRAAINAAIEMRQGVRDYNQERQLPMPLDLHVGIHSGLGIAGDISGPLLRDFAVMGEPVDVAAQLTELAESGQIFVSSDTMRFTRNLFEFAPAQGAAGSRAGEVFELLSVRSQLHRERIGAQRRVFSDLVGRETELAELRSRLAALRDGRGGAVSLVAEAGLGKSRLVAELLASAGAEGVECHEGRSISTGRNLRYHPFADLCRSWSGIEDDDDEETARAKLEATLARLFAEEVAETLPLLAGVIGMRLDAAQRERLERISGDALEKLFRRALTEMFRRASRLRPTIVVMDDLHWADDSSIELIESLLPLAIDHPILFVNVTRPGFAATGERVLEVARSEPGLAHLELRLAGLSRAAARQLVNNLFEADSLPHATRAAIEEKAQGNPFYIEEVVRSLVDEGAVAYSDGRFRATEKIHDVVIPATLHEVVLSRVDRLGLRRKSLLQLASVIGRSFHQRVLAAVVTDAGALESSLSELEAAEFIVPWDQTRGIEWAFKHPLIQEVTYDALLETKREELHRQVARAIESALSDEIPGYAGMLAYHYSMGREIERAEEYLFRAGEEAARVAASSEALQFFREASRLYLELHGEGGDPVAKALLEKKLGLALYHRGQLIEADQHFNGALRLLGERVPRGQRELVLRFVRNLIAVLAGLYLRGGERPPATDKDRDVIDLMMKRAEAQTTASPARFVFDSMDTLARLDQVRASSVPGAGGMFAGAVGIFSYGGVSFRLGRRFLARAQRLVRTEDVPERLSYRVMNFLHHLLAGDWSDEHRVEDELLEQGLHYGRLWEVTNALNLEGLKAAYQGDFAGARVRIERLGKLADQYQHELAASAGQFLTALLHLERRELREAIAALDHYADEHPEAAFRISALGHRAAAEWLRGDADGAEATLERAERLVREAGRVLPYHLTSFLRSRYLLDLHRLEAAAGGSPRSERTGRARRARRSRKAALASAARVAWRRPEVLRMAGTHAWLLGRRHEARARWGESLDQALRLGMRPEQARTRAEMGRRLLARAGQRDTMMRREADALLEAARLGFESLGLEAELRGLPEPPRA